MFGRPNAAVLLLLFVVAAALVIPGSARPGEDSETSSERSSDSSSKSMSKNPCAVERCNSNGRCIELKKDFVCDCDCGYAGEFCDQNVDDCIGTPCGEHGTCTDWVATFNCTCNSGFDGTLCENNINDCAGNPCKHGECTDGVNEYSCKCYPGYEGDNCETNSDNCLVDQCNRQGQCFDLVDGFVCKCYNGYMGDSCEQNVDDCEGTPCGEHGKCTDGIASFTCECDLGFDGTRCENNINDCATNPCQYGNCIDGVNEYLCSCYDGFTGDNCETNLDCDKLSCNEGGRCIDLGDLVEGVACACDPGFEGQFCDTYVGPPDTDTCVPCPRMASYCLNGATLSHQSNGFPLCQCTSNSGQWTGARCGYAANACTTGGATLTAPFGVVQSHATYDFFKNTYAHRVACSWSIEVAEGMAVRLTFNTFDLDVIDNFSVVCLFDIVRIYDGSSSRSGLLGEYCRVRVRPNVTISTGRRMYITFISDSSIRGTGFEFIWESVAVQQ